MRIEKIAALVACAALSGLLAGHAIAAEKEAPAEEAPGRLPYTPTRSEWAVVWLSQKLGVIVSPGRLPGCASVVSDTKIRVRCVVYFERGTGANVTEMFRKLAEAAAEQLRHRPGFETLELILEIETK